MDQMQLHKPINVEVISTHNILLAVTFITFTIIIFESEKSQHLNILGL